MKWKHKYAALMKEIADEFGFWCCGDDDGFSCDILTQDNNKIASIRFYNDGEIYHFSACQGLAYKPNYVGLSNTYRPHSIYESFTFWSETDNIYIDDNMYLSNESKYRVLNHDYINFLDENDLVKEILNLKNDFNLLLTAKKRYLSEQKIKDLEKDFV